MASNDRPQRPTLDPQGDGFTYTAVAKPGAFERLGENLAEINRGFAERDAREGR